VSDTKTIWIMTAISESGDHYNACEIWDHEPSQEEINRVRVLLDATEFDPESDEEDWEGFILLDGKKWITYILNYDIDKREIKINNGVKL
jgi:hypothetical protein